ncbi:helix-turn-helix transcriptional regulator [Pseudomonas sp. KSR10]|uniref:LexA family transcriptional regulator n=1 Tax=Pseudomonas sp. KSR10 TaxID=2916654 RepID=UPI001EF901A0|nr:helix-turn-helix transcriptional regulator [Pseudomonas sp. KSR10]MCG6541729.1 helix-turn-helix transcriptional regulator [Pseudomonas sp. KSR10]
MNESGNRLRELLDQRGIAYKDFAENLGVESQHVNHWFKRGIPKARIFQIADNLKVSPRWLAEGTGDPLLDPSFNHERAGALGWRFPTDPEVADQLSPVCLEPLAAWDSSTPLDSDEVELRLYKEVELSSGHGRTAVQEIGGPKLRFSRSTMRQCGVDPEHAVFATNSGNSNHPLILHGATIGVDKGMTRVVDGEIYALDHDGLLRVKFLERLPGGGLRLKSYNHAEFKDEDFSFDQVMEQRIVILGRVFWWSTIRPLRSAPLI